MKKVLILGVAAVQMDAVIQLRKMGCTVYCCAMANDGPASRYADHFEQINFMEVEKLKKYMEKEKFDCVYSVGSDIAMPVVGKLSEELGLPYFVSYSSARICNNKNKFREFMGKDFKGNIEFQVMKEKDEMPKISYPFIMKPTDSQGQRGVKIIGNYNRFLEEFEDTKKFSKSNFVIIEEYLNSEEMSANAYFVNGKLEFCVLSDRITWPQFEGGIIHKHIVPSKRDELFREKVRKMVEETASKLNIKNGPVYFQIKMKDNEPKVIETTPRLDGCHMWRILKEYTGVNLLKLTFEHLLFNKTDELKKLKESNNKYILEFMCKEPNTKANYSEYKIPSNAIYSFKYYNEGDMIRSINGKLEKIGYYIIKEN